MSKLARKPLFLGIAVVLLLTGALSVWVMAFRADLQAAASPNIIYTDAFGIAIKGYDPVAYFTEHRPVQGNSRYEVIWQDARWHFANTGHRDLFVTDPERYAPQFGGFCTSYLAKGRMAGANPEIWAIVDGKLYLKAGKKEENWINDDMIKHADEEWAKLQSKS